MDSDASPVQSTAPPGRVWRPLPFAACWVLAGALYATWALPPCDALWADVDGSVFAALNGTLVGGGTWARLCAHLNTRPVDVGWAVLMAGLCGLFAARGGGRPARERIAIAGVLSVGVLAGILLAKKVFPAEPRLSPGAVVEGFHDLSAMFPEIGPKVVTRNSFPGDHAVASFVFLAGFVVLVGGRWIAPAALVALLNAFPRLIGGGHWLSDAVVGGVVVGLIVVPFMVAAPSVAWMERILDRVRSAAPRSG